MDKNLEDLVEALSLLVPDQIDRRDLIQVKITNTVSDVSKSVVCSFMEPSFLSDMQVGMAWLCLDENSMWFKQLQILRVKSPAGDMDWTWRATFNLMDLFLQADLPIVLQSTVAGPIGSTGDTGPQGLAGPPGPQGPRGLPGMTTLPISEIKRQLKALLNSVIQIQTVPTVRLPRRAFGNLTVPFSIIKIDGFGAHKDISDQVQIRLSLPAATQFVAKTNGSELVIDVERSIPQDLTLTISCLYQPEYPMNPLYAETHLPVVWTDSTRLEVRGQVEYSLPTNWNTELELHYQLVFIEGVVEKDLSGLASFEVEAIEVPNPGDLIRVVGSSVFLMHGAVDVVKAFVIKSTYTPTGSALGYRATKEVTIKWIPS